MLVENNSDELRVGVKGQSSSVIARSPRNSFRASLGKFRDGGRALDGLGGLQAYRIQRNSECRSLLPRESDSGG